MLRLTRLFIIDLTVSSDQIHNLINQTINKHHHKQGESTNQQIHRAANLMITVFWKIM